MKKLFIFIFLFLLCSTVHAETLTLPSYPMEVGGSLTANRINGWLQAISNVLNGGLDNNNPNLDAGFRFIEIVNSLPAAGNEGRVVFYTANDTLYFDNGTSLIAVAVLTNTQTFTGDNTFTGTTTIQGGSIDNTTIGATTPSTGAFTTLKVGTTNQGDILYDNGTSLARLTPGTSGQVLQTQGASANPQWATSSGFELFTSSGTFTAPEGITEVLVSLVGGGGGGGTHSGGSGGGGGGGGAYATNVLIEVTGGNGYTVTVGAAGSYGGPDNTAGGNGGESSFAGDSVTVSVNGGTGGAGGGLGSGGAGGTASSTYSVPTIAGVAGGAQSGGEGGYGGGSIFGTGGHDDTLAVGYGSGGNGDDSNQVGDAMIPKGGAVVIAY